MLALCLLAAAWQLLVAELSRENCAALPSLGGNADHNPKTLLSFFS